jgi:hypothetical protein
MPNQNRVNIYVQSCNCSVLIVSLVKNKGNVADRSLDRYLERYLDRYLDRSLDRPLGRPSDRSMYRSPESYLDMSLDRSLDRYFDDTWTGKQKHRCAPRQIKVNR